MGHRILPDFRETKQILSAQARLAIAEARVRELEAQCASLKESIVLQLRSYASPGFLGAVDDPIYMEAMRIEGMGFEEAHELRPCGHSRGDYRDPKYGTSEYAGDERCVACDQITVLKVENERLKAPVSDDEANQHGFYLHGNEGWDDGIRFTPGQVNRLLLSRSAQPEPNARKKQIAEVGEEIAVIQSVMRGRYATQSEWQRILARGQAALAELKKGWKP